MSARLRWTLWATLLAAGVYLVLTDERAPTPDRVVDAAPRAAPAATREQARRAAESKEPPMIDAIRPRKVLAGVDNAFSVRDWSPPPLPPRQNVMQPAPPARPVAPPLPFKVLGKKLEDGQWQVFLVEDNMLHVVRAQDSIEDRYRVVEIRPPTMTFLYTPLNERQVLQIGGAE